MADDGGNGASVVPPVGIVATVGTVVGIVLNVSGVLLGCIMSEVVLLEILPTTDELWHRKLDVDDKRVLMDTMFDELETERVSVTGLLILAWG